MRYWKQLSRTPTEPVVDETRVGGMKNPAGSSATTQPLSSSPVVLVYHGTFGPMHLGHIACIKDSTRLAEDAGLSVRRFVVGFTTPEYAWNKQKDPESVCDGL
eukprot:2283404-Amphidinium_carterae.2